MIQILLLILKIIGITLLVLLGLVLLVLALVLFVPVFYRVRVVHNPKKTQVNGRVRFLFPLLSVTFQYLKKITYRVRVFGFSVLDSEKPKKEKKDNKKKKGALKKKKQKKQEHQPEGEKKSEDKPEPIQNVTEPVVSEAVPELEMKAEEEQPLKQSFFEKIRVKIQKVRETVSNVVNKVKKLLHQKDEVLRILSKPESKHAIAFAWDKLKHLLRHVLPRKMKGYVAYGADNPATTGQVLGIIGVMYAKTGPLLEIRPNFEEPQMECDVELRGRVQLFTLIVIAVKVFFNQELRQLIADFKNVKNVE